MFSWGRRRLVLENMINTSHICEIKCLYVWRQVEFRSLSHKPGITNPTKAALLLVLNTSYSALSNCDCLILFPAIPSRAQIYWDVATYTDIYIKLDVWFQRTRAPRDRNPGTGETKRGSFPVVYMIKQSRGVLEMMRCNKWIRMHQSRASGAIHLLR